jgi:uncharacterized protein (DUF58 family)
MAMRVPLIPSRAGVAVLTAAAVAACGALLAGLPLAAVSAAAGLFALGAIVWVAVDLLASRRAWGRSPLRVERVLPRALAVGAPAVIKLRIANESGRALTVSVFDEVDPGFAFEGLPQSIRVPAGAQAELRYTATPRSRGRAHFGHTQLRWRSLGGSAELLQSMAAPASLHVYPNFAAVAGYAWLAGDKRLAQIGIKTYAQRGQGTDFRQLSDYKRGDAIRHIDWKATLRQRKPIVREFQDDRDQCVLFLLDCGRRMRADEGGSTEVAGSHFDQALNALMLLGYVALKEGDEVGVMTFGNAPGEQREFAPRKGTHTLNALMNRLYDIEPGAAHSDYLVAAQSLLAAHRKRALVIVLTNFRDEDTAELKPALKLLRRRHLVMVASLRERVLREMAEKPLAQARNAVDAATAHLFEQSRRDAFRRVVGNDALSIDVEPAQLAVSLVNRYHAVKRAGLL